MFAHVCATTVSWVALALLVVHARAAAAGVRESWAARDLLLPAAGCMCAWAALGPLLMAIDEGEPGPMPARAALLKSLERAASCAAGAAALLMSARAVACVESLRHSEISESARCRVVDTLTGAVKRMRPAQALAATFFFRVFLAVVSTIASLSVSSHTPPSGATTHAANGTIRGATEHQVGSACEWQYPVDSRIKFAFMTRLFFAPLLLLLVRESARMAAALNTLAFDVAAAAARAKDGQLGATLAGLVAASRGLTAHTLLGFDVTWRGLAAVGGVLGCISTEIAGAPLMGLVCYVIARVCGQAR